MADIYFSVTPGVLAHAQGAQANQRQIAYTRPSADIAPRFRTLTATNRVLVRIAGQLTLTFGDTSAIWLAHNTAVAEDFLALFTLLARHPCRDFRFFCELVG